MNENNQREISPLKEEHPELKKAYVRLDSFSDLKTISPEKAEELSKKRQIAERDLFHVLDKRVQTKEELEIVF